MATAGLDIGGAEEGEVNFIAAPPPSLSPTEWDHMGHAKRERQEFRYERRILLTATAFAEADLFSPMQDEDVQDYPIMNPFRRESLKMK